MKINYQETLPLFDSGNIIKNPILSPQSCLIGSLHLCVFIINIIKKISLYFYQKRYFTCVRTFKNIPKVREKQNRNYL